VKAAKVTRNQSGGLVTPADVADPLEKMKPVEIRFPSSQVQCPHCKAAMQLVRHIDLKGMPDIYIFYCNGCQHVETVKEERAA
jgi:hypothetical protein